jgi:hypothetical protein
MFSSYEDNEELEINCSVNSTATRLRRFRVREEKFGDNLADTPEIVELSVCRFSPGNELTNPLSPISSKTDSA